jgi:protoheme IX farnesyltransferase
VTAAANTINEYLERDIDKKMERTMNRPLPQERMSGTEALIFAIVSAIAGLFIFTFYFNLLSALLSGFSLLFYAFLYTPMKKINSLAVFLGAIPGALPPAIGYVASSGVFDIQAWVWFGIQFFWQFAHFWAIAWLRYEDYLKVNIMLLPDSHGKTKKSAYYTFVYTILLIPLSIISHYICDFNIYSTIILTVSSIIFSVLAFRFFQTTEDKSARVLMFGSFFYLPIAQIAMLCGKF